MRVYYVKRARASKTTRRCRRCGHEIQPGESYKYINPRFGPYINFCFKHGPRQSDLTGGKLSELYAAQEGLEDDIVAFRNGGDLDDLKSSTEMAADEGDRIADEYEESISNMPDGLQESPVAEECRERSEAAREWAEELRAVDLEMNAEMTEDEDAEEPDLCPEHGTTNEDGCDPCAEYWTKIEAQANTEEEADEEEERERIASELEGVSLNV